MRRLLAILLLLAIPAGANVYQGSGVNSGFRPACPSGLCALNVPSARLPQYEHATAAEANYQAAQGWTEYDVTCSSSCASGRAPIRDIVSVGTCANLVTTASAGASLDCFVDNAPNDVVLFVPDDASRYAMSVGVASSNDRVVIRGQSRSGTILERTTTGRTFISSGPCDANSGAMLFSFCAPSQNGTTTTWTAGYAIGGTVVTVTSTTGMSVGGWIDLWMTANLACEHIDRLLNSGGTPDTLHHQAKITNISGSDVTIDSPLRLDYAATGCTGQSARPWVPLTGVGVERLRLTTTTTIPQGDNSGTDIKFTMIFMTGVAESWFVNTDEDRVHEAWTKVAYSARNWFQGNNYSNSNAAWDFNTEGLSFEEAATNNVAENNWFDAPRVATKNEGSEGTVWAYNYTTMATGTAERAYFNHGHYARHVLLEGNDVNSELLVGDAFWGRNGLTITAYRNRNRLTSCVDSNDGITFDLSLSSGTPCGGTCETVPWNADLPNVVGNIAHQFHVAPKQTSPACPPSIKGDGVQPTLEDQTNDGWFERNVYRYNSAQSFDMTGSTAANRSCGTALSDSCPGTNQQGEGPHSEANLAYPNTLYRTRAVRPTWWCQEACSWDYNGIGAWGDNFTGALCKLPAQIRAEAGACTPTPL